MLYILDGNIGAGKTTLIRKLSKYYTCVEEPVHEWSLLSKFYDNKKKYALPFFIQILASYHKLFSQLPKTSSTVIVERSPFISREIFIPILRRYNCWSDYDDRVYKDLYERFNVPLHDKLLYLSVPPKMCEERILQRNRPGEKIDMDYLIELDTQYNSSVLTMKNTVVFDGTYDAYDSLRSFLG